MIRSYNRTIFTEDLTKAKVRLYIHDGNKYEGSTTTELVEYTGLTSWDIIEGGKEAEEIEKSGMVDPNHEYLVLHFQNLETATYCNSNVDLFIR